MFETNDLFLHIYSQVIGYIVLFFNESDWFEHLPMWWRLVDQLNNKNTLAAYQLIIINTSPNNAFLDSRRIAAPIPAKVTIISSCPFPFALQETRPRISKNRACHFRADTVYYPQTHNQRRAPRSPRLFSARAAGNSRAAIDVLYTI